MDKMIHHFNKISQFTLVLLVKGKVMQNTSLVKTPKLNTYSTI